MSTSIFSDTGPGGAMGKTAAQEVSGTSDFERGMLEFVAQMNDIYEDAKRRTEERRTRLAENRAFARGMQHGRVDRWGRWTPLAPVDPRVHFETMPIVGQQVQVAVERRISTWPSIDVKAPAPGIVAEVQASMMEDLARAWRSIRDDYYLAMLTSDYQAEIDGAGFLKTVWDPALGDHDPTVPAGELPYTGDWNVVPVSSLEAIVDPTATTLPKARFVIHRKAAARTDAEQSIPTDIFGKPTATRFLPWGQRTRSFGDDPRMEPMSGAIDENQTVEICEFWWRPNAEWPQGLLLVVSGDMALAYPTMEHEEPGAEEAGIPARQTMIPCLPDGFFPWDLNIGSNFVPDAIFADGAVSRLISPQKSLNHGYSRMRQALNWGSMPAMLVPFQSEVKQKAFSDIGGDIVKYRYPYKPEILKGDGVNAGHLSYVADVRNLMNDISGYTDESRGLVNSANATAARIQTTTALNTQLHGSTLTLRGFLVANITRKIFKLIANRYEPGRLLYGMGKNNRVRVAAFIDGMINTDGVFMVDPSSTVPKDRNQERTDAREDFIAGAYDDTPAASRYRRAMNIAQEADGEINPDVIDYRNAKERAVTFLLAARKGEVPTNVFPRIGDNNDIHLDIYRLVTLEPAFDELDPALQDWFTQNVIVPHQEIRRAKLGEQLSEEADISGATGGAKQLPPGKGSQAAPGDDAPPGRPQGSDKPTSPAEDAPPS